MTDDQHAEIFRRYQRHTMVPWAKFKNNLAIAATAPDGCIVECGVWRGGMSAALADVLPGRVHYLLDSFEGLPAAGDKDGDKAQTFEGKCAAEMHEAEAAMGMSKGGAAHLVRGWFKDTLPTFEPGPIAILRLDGDWYESTMECMTALVPRVVPGGLVIIDDYLAWEGCRRAVHDYMSRHQRSEPIRETWAHVNYIRIAAG